MKFSVLMSVYINDDPIFLDGAINSVLVDQSLKPNQLVIVKDGQLNKGCDEILNKWQSNDLVKIINIDVNIGLGGALNEGLKHCNYNLVARMDSDDICDSNRFKTQITEFINDDDSVLLGSNIIEFNNSVGDCNLRRIVPQSETDIRRFKNYRNPFNHMTVMFKKDIIISAGGYIKMLYYEDYYLWLRVIASGFKIKNLDQFTVHVRSGNALVRRRKGFKIIVNEFKFYYNCFKNRLIPKYIILTFGVLRMSCRLLPLFIFKRIFIGLMRSKKSN